ncbi:MAG: hypothetical protein V2B15_08230 [Bacteroidota bacterium]
MKKIFIVLALVLATSTLYSQDNLKADRYLMLDAKHERDPELETHTVPEGEVWKIESAICHREVETINLRISEVSYVIGVYEEKESLAPKLPFYLPAGTEFKLWTSDGYPGLVSICVLKIE